MPEPIVGQVVFHPPDVVIGYPAPRPWEQKLQDLVAALEPIEYAYTTNKGLSNEGVRRDVEDFFRYCRELADWLWQNTAVSEQTIRQLIKNSHYLRLADAMAQTTKHHTRTGKNPITAHIAEIRGTSNGFRARIDWSRAKRHSNNSARNPAAARGWSRARRHRASGPVSGSGRRNGSAGADPATSPRCWPRNS